MMIGMAGWLPSVWRSSLLSSVRQAPVCDDQCGSSNPLRHRRASASVWAMVSIDSSRRSSKAR
ncbi:MAG: hypothetical protein MZV64_24330 [Ignavibacteriales bacterium]|nr:hypothetical protein [Ignavibacteriales bacterium]